MLADPEQLAAERDAVESWLRNGGSARAVLVAVAASGNGDELLQQFPFVDDVLVRPVTPARLKLKLERAVEGVHNRRIIRQLHDALTRKHDELNELNEIGRQLSAERDIDKLLELILQKSRKITGRRRREPVPGRARARRRERATARPAALQAGAERHHGAPVRGVGDAARRDLDRGLRGA